MLKRSNEDKSYNYFLDGYIEGLINNSTVDVNDEGDPTTEDTGKKPEPLHKFFSKDNISSEAMAKIKSVTKSFYSKAGELNLLDDFYGSQHDMNRLGALFLESRTNSGENFDDYYTDGKGLDNLAKKYQSEVMLYLGDDYDENHKDRAKLYLWDESKTAAKKASSNTHIAVLDETHSTRNRTRHVAFDYNPETGDLIVKGNIPAGTSINIDPANFNKLARSLRHKNRG